MYRYLSSHQISVVVVVVVVFVVFCLLFFLFCFFNSFTATGDNNRLFANNIDPDETAQ